MPTSDVATAFLRTADSAARPGLRNQTAATSPAAATIAPPPASRRVRMIRMRRSRSLSRSAATATSTRAFCASSTSGSGRKAAAMRMIVSSASSCTGLLRQQPAQGVAGAFDAHLQRRDTRASGDRHVVVRQVFHVSHQERLALLGWERRQRTRDLLTPGDGLVVAPIVRPLRHLPELDELRAPPLAGAGAPTPIR